MTEAAPQLPDGRIILITGNMASGRSSVAQALAERLDSSDLTVDEAVAHILAEMPAGIEG